MKSIGDSTLTNPATENQDAKITDYFTTKDGQTFAGRHLLVEVWEGENLTDPLHIEKTLCMAAEASGATILHSHMHHFSPFDGVSGVVLLAESHISIHTWPERSYAAIDIFMCGECDPHLALPAIKSGLKATNLSVQELRRGIVQDDNKRLTE